MLGKGPRIAPLEEEILFKNKSKSTRLAETPALSGVKASKALMQIIISKIKDRILKFATASPMFLTEGPAAQSNTKLPGFESRFTAPYKTLKATYPHYGLKYRNGNRTRLALHTRELLEYYCNPVQVIGDEAQDQKRLVCSYSEQVVGGMPTFEYMRHIAIDENEEHELTHLLIVTCIFIWYINALFLNMKNLKCLKILLRVSDP